MLTEQQKNNCLKVDPLAEDFGITVRTLKDKVIKVRDDHSCNICEAEIIKGALARTRVEIFDNAFHTYYWCNTCCLAMSNLIDNTENADYEYQERYSIGERLRKDRYDRENIN